MQDTRLSTGPSANAVLSTLRTRGVHLLNERMHRSNREQGLLPEFERGEALLEVRGKVRA